MVAGTPRRILLTGAQGFVGEHLVEAIRTSLPGSELDITRFDVTDKAAVLDTVRRVRPDACVHLAAVSAISNAQLDPETAWRVNLGGTLNLAHILAAEVPGCTLLFVSSAEAYGRSFMQGDALDETAALNPNNMYGATKAAADLALGAMAREALHVIRARPFNHTGPGQTPAFVVSAFARQIALIKAGKQPPLLQVGALDPTRDFLDVRDVCACYARCLQEHERIPTGTILNIASGHPRRIGDILDELLELAGVEVKVTVDTARLRPTEIRTVAGNSNHARELLGWSPTIPWRQTLSDILEHWRLRIEAEPA